MRNQDDLLGLTKNTAFYPIYEAVLEDDALEINSNTQLVFSQHP